MASVRMPSWYVLEPFPDRSRAKFERLVSRVPLGRRRVVVQIPIPSSREEAPVTDAIRKFAQRKSVCPTAVAASTLV